MPGEQRRQPRQVIVEEALWLASYEVTVTRKEEARYWGHGKQQRLWSAWRETIVIRMGRETNNNKKQGEQGDGARRSQDKGISVHASNRK